MASIVYHVTYQIIVSYVFLNLFVAVVMEGFENSNNIEGLPICEYDLDIFREHWKKYDPKGSCFINIEDLDNFIKDLV